MCACLHNQLQVALLGVCPVSAAVQLQYLYHQAGGLADVWSACHVLHLFVARAELVVVGRVYLVRLVTDHTLFTCNFSPARTDDESEAVYLCAVWPFEPVNHRCKQQQHSGATHEG